MNARTLAQGLPDRPETFSGTGMDAATDPGRAPEPVAALLSLPHFAGLDLPQYKTEQAAGVDLCAAVPADGPVTLAPGQRALIPTGLAMALPPGFEAQIRPRSGLAIKDGITCLNSPGTIDADYRGEVQIILINHGARPFTVRRGERIAQMVIAPVTRVRFQIADTLDQTARGAGGFGSTGR